MKRRHNKVADSDEDIDDLPLKYISSDHKIVTIKELKKYSSQACEFCEEHFKNRYDFFIHNARHIIIPLIKMLPNPCSECGSYFMSEEEKIEHMSVKHKTVVKSKSLHKNDTKTKISDRLQFENANVKEEPNEDERPLKWFVKKEIDIAEEVNNTVKNEVAKEEVKGEVKEEPENILQNFMIHCKVDVEKFLPPDIYQSVEDCDLDDIMDICERDYKNPVDELGPSLAQNHVTHLDEPSPKNKIGQKTFSYNNVVKTEADHFENARVIHDSSSEFSDLDEDPIVILAPVKNNEETESVHDSVHFNDLIKPGIFYCKRCFKRFPNRFEVIVHEVSHLDLSKTAPEGCKITHNNSKTTVPLTSGLSKQDTCKHCKEEILDKKAHAKTCFTMFCSACAKGFNSKWNLKVHEEKCNGEAEVNLCNICLYMRKKPKHITYRSIMKYPKFDMNNKCHWCGQLTYEMSLVTIRIKKKKSEEQDLKEQEQIRLKDQIRFEDEEKEAPFPQVNVNKVNEDKSRKNGMNERGGGRHKILSNRERLKLIQQRLKLMKK